MPRVRVSPLGPKNRNGPCHSGFLHWRGETRKINAARMSAAGDGLTEPNIYFLPIGKKMQTSLAIWTREFSPLGRENSRHLDFQIPGTANAIPVFCILGVILKKTKCCRQLNGCNTLFFIFLLIAGHTYAGSGI